MQDDDQWWVALAVSKLTKIRAKRSDGKIECSFARVDMHNLSLYQPGWSPAPYDLLKEDLERGLVDVPHNYKDLYIEPRTLPWRKRSQTLTTNMHQIRRGIKGDIIPTFTEPN